MLGESTEELTGALASLFTPFSAVSFLIFTLLYTPCVAAVAAIKRELNSGIAALGVVAAQCGIAWLVSFVVYRLAMLFV